MTDTEKDAKQPVQFWPRGGLRAELEARSRDDSRAALGATAQRDALRYYEVLRRTLDTVDLSQPEALLLCDALNGSRMGQHSASLLWAEIDDAIRMRDLADKWHVDGPGLVERLRRLSYGQALSVVDAVERVLLGLSQDDRTASLKAVGLIR